MISSFESVKLDSITQQVAGGRSETATPSTNRRSPSPSSATNLCKLHQNTTATTTTTHKLPNAVHSLSATPAASSLTGTPVRKVSASSFLSSITQFYTGAATVPTPNVQTTDQEQLGHQQHQQQQGCAVDGCNGAEESFPEIKGRVESKLMSMWHNVKYGKLFKFSQKCQMFI